MKNIELLPISEEAKKRLNEFATQYKRFAHVIVEIVSFNEGRLIVRVEQKDLVNGKMLTKKELAIVSGKCLTGKSRQTGS